MNSKPTEVFSESVMSVAAFISVRSASTRLPRKCFLEFGGQTVLEHVVRRALHYGLAPVVCTTDLKEDDEIEELCRKFKWPIFRGASSNKMKRWLDCCNTLSIEKFHSVDADDPFFCGDEVKRSMRMLDEQQLDIVEPTINSSNGKATVGYSLRKSLIAKALADVDEKTDTEMMWGFIDRLGNVRKARLSGDDDGTQFSRRTLDYNEDYVFLYALLKMVGPFASLGEVDSLIQKVPELTKINATRNEDWKNLQQEKLASI